MTEHKPFKKENRYNHQDQEGLNSADVYKHERTGEYRINQKILKGLLNFSKCNCLINEFNLNPIIQLEKKNFKSIWMLTFFAVMRQKFWLDGE